MAAGHWAAGHWAAGALRIIAVGGRRRPGISVSSSSALGCWLATGRMGAIGPAKLPRPPVLIRGFSSVRSSALR